MGCEESRTIDDRPFAREDSGYIQQPQPQFQNGSSVCFKILHGYLESDQTGFKDTVIKNEKELEDNIKMYIPTYIKDKNGQQKPNIIDDILTNSLKIDFNKQYVVVMNAINITDVLEKKGNYFVRHDNRPGSVQEYNAAVVRKLPGNPIIIMEKEKPFPVD